MMRIILALQFAVLLVLLVFFFGAPTPLSAQESTPPPSSTASATPSATVEASANTVSAEALPPMMEMVVTANRLDVPASQVASSLTVITAKDLEQKQASTLENALQGAPGLDLSQTGGPGQSSSLFIRGANEGDVLVMMDGVPLNDPIQANFSYDYLDQLSVDGVNRIEVVRGPQSALYGSSAVAGVVNVISQEGRGPLGGSLSFEGGSYGTFRESLSTGSGDEKGNFSLSLSRLDTSGFPSLVGGTVSNPDQDTTAFLKLGSSLSSNFTQKLSVRYSQSHTSLDAYDPYTFLLTDDPNYTIDQKQFLVVSQSRWTLDSQWDQVLGLSFTDDNRVYNASPNGYTSYYEQGQFDGGGAQLDWQNNLRLSKEETVVAGFQGQGQWGSMTDANNGAGQYDGLGNAVTVTDSVMGVNTWLGSLFVNSQTNLNDRFFLNGGARLDGHSQFGSHATYQAGAAYFIPGWDTKLKANFGTGFVAPSLYQLYDPTYGTKGLQPETSTGFDAGFEQPLAKGAFTVGATYFHNDFTNLIDFDSTLHFNNIGQAQSEGWETFLSVQPLPGLKSRLQYTYDWAVDNQTGLQLLRRPQNQAGMDVTCALGPSEWETSLVYVGQRLDFGPVTLPDYFLVNLRVSFKVDEHFKLFARVDNLFNEVYQETYSFATPGLSGYVGTKVSF